jgi:hypothetical protein
MNLQTWKINTAGNRRLITNMPEMNACPILENIDRFPLLKGQLDFMSQTFPGLVHKCPYTVCRLLNLVEIVERDNILSQQSIKCDNASILAAKRSNWQWFPNGKYRTLINISDGESKDFVFSLTYYHENVFHFEAGEF